jgi:hypothetical protein
MGRCVSEFSDRSILANREQALHFKAFREGPIFRSNCVVHYLSIRYAVSLAEAGASVGSVGDSFDKGLP